MTFTSEAVRNAILVKLWAQEPVIEARLGRLRQAELSAIQGILWVSVAMHTISRCAPTVISVAAFVVALVSGHELTSGRVFPALSMCALLTSSLSQIPPIAAALAACFASYARLREGCDMENIGQLDRHGTRNAYHDTEETSAALIVDDVSVKWCEGDPYVIRNASFTAREGEIVVLNGDSCTGKSTLLKVITGTLEPTRGRVDVRGTMAYMSQDSWLMAGTIEENILFGRPMEREFYERVIRACTLDVDLAMMDNGDATMTGALGAGLSGGQKSRVALARAVYSRADLYILDDPLAALDSQVQAQILERVLGPRGLLQGKTRVIVSDAAALLRCADKVLHLANGVVLENSYAMPLLVVSASRATAPELAILSPKRVIRASTEVCLDDIQSETLTQLPDLQACGEGDFLRGRDNKAFNDDSEDTSTLIPASLYVQWLRIAGFWRWLIVALLTVLAFLSSVLANSMLKLVAQEMEGGSATKGIWLYAAGGVVQTLMAVVSLASAWYLGLRRTLQRIHELLVAGLFGTPVQVLSSIPQGTLINRFANDLVRSDMAVFGSMFGLLNQVVAIFMSFSVLIAAVPVAVTAVLPSVALSWRLLRMSLPALLKARTIENQSRNPLLTNLQETEAGRDTIQVFAREDLFRNRNFTALRLNLQAYMAGVLVHLWLLIRLHFIAA